MYGEGGPKRMENKLIAHLLQQSLKNEMLALIMMLVHSIDRKRELI